MEFCPSCEKALTKSNVVTKMVEDKEAYSCVGCGTDVTDLLVRMGERFPLNAYLGRRSSSAEPIHVDNNGNDGQLRRKRLFDTYF